MKPSAIAFVVAELAVFANVPVWAWNGHPLVALAYLFAVLGFAWIYRELDA